jgi:hypothetical protein
MTVRAKCAADATAAFGRIALAAVLAATAGCARAPLAGEYTPATASCCASPAEFRYRALAPGVDTEFHLSPTEPAFNFDGRLQHFAAFAVPDGVRASALHVTSYLTAEFLPSAAAVNPDFIFLDGNFAGLGKSPIADMQWKKGFWRGGLEGRAAIPSGTKYIIVIAGRGGNVLPVVYSENRTAYRIPPAAMGDLAIKLFGERQ